VGLLASQGEVNLSNWLVLEQLYFIYTSQQIVNVTCRMSGRNNRTRCNI